MYDILQLNDMLVTELKEIANQLGIKGYHKLTKQEVIYKILDEQALAEKKSGGEHVPVVEEPAPGRKIVVRKEPLKDDANKSDAAKLVGKAIAKALLAKGIDKVVFDRNGYLFHGRIKALADAAREAGLKF